MCVAHWLTTGAAFHYYCYLVQAGRPASAADSSAGPERERRPFLQRLRAHCAR
jgi:hypothetical protein